jgi:hypothetical protein
VYRQEDKNYFSLSKIEIYQLNEISHRNLKNFDDESFLYDEFFQYLQELKIDKQDIEL